MFPYFEKIIVSFVAGVAVAAPGGRAEEASAPSSDSSTESAPAINLDPLLNGAAHCPGAHKAFDAFRESLFEKYTPCARKVVSGFRKKRTERKHWYTHTPDSSGVWVYQGGLDAKKILIKPVQVI